MIACFGLIFLINSFTIHGYNFKELVYKGFIPSLLIFSIGFFSLSNDIKYSQQEDYHIYILNIMVFRHYYFVHKSNLDYYYKLIYIILNIIYIYDNYNYNIYNV